jgi:hypothetical protein
MTIIVQNGMFMLFGMVQLKKETSLWRSCNFAGDQAGQKMRKEVPRYSRRAPLEPGNTTKRKIGGTG